MKQSVCAGVSSGEVQGRLSDIMRYARELQNLGVQIPESTFSISETGAAPVLQIRSRFITGRNAYSILTTAGEKDCIELVANLTKVVIPIAESLNTERGVGYDTALANFIVDENSKAIFCVDLTPPRLKFEADANGAERLIAWSNLLVNYPEGPPIDPAYHEVLKRFYYTPIGTIEHLYCWMTTARLNHPERLSVSPYEWKGRDAKLILDVVLQELTASSQIRGIADEIARRTSEGALDAFMHRRVTKSRLTAESSIRLENYSIERKSLN